ncbi:MULTISPECIES: isopentenyl-diphosphate Delta-isomerase [Microbacterium]|uniref:isopentenyl-diphosphate Delta-isomerase n=1 Tax=Microbacterium TaxID=33882 RepID=UPI00277F1C6A|nr:MULTISPECIES: isopentenyl-diphosphate Delta-isomerase [Microbacterium]MDQ1083847.1 isopentenyl-diphosphate delta-isomerase [Microbacterium sp. SORGH_AS_0344]MDQ1170874.1 isopentenyl-diphosphate delta-isomerase [Microbacterium proteolyticum]
MSETEYVVLLDDFGNDIGTAPKASVHDTETALHLAFSCHVLNGDGKVLVTRRALHKKTWPGVWTNSFCGHPAPAEPLAAAVHRRAEFEVGLRVRDLELALPQFRYRAVDASGIVEHEICPVFVAHTDDDPRPNPDEVAEYRWVDPLDLAAALSATPWAFSPWLVLQAQQLHLFADPSVVRRAS